MTILKGKVAVVTGGARDIGRAISVGLAIEGAKEVADLVIYLASDNSSFITGANYDINGGLAFS